jgi:kynurenine formamidase
MKRLFDLTRLIEDNQPVYPGDDPTTLRRSRTLQENGFNNHRLQISMHSGTHIDGPMHMTDSRIYLDEIPLEQFVGKGILLDVRGEREIKMKPEYEDKIPQESIVLFWTGRDVIFGSEEYFLNNPSISPVLADLLVEKKTKIVGLDSSSPDKYPFEIHAKLFAAGILVMENLTGLERLVEFESFTVFALPLRIHADSSVARVIAGVEIL